MIKSTQRSAHSAQNANKHLNLLTVESAGRVVYYPIKEAAPILHPRYTYVLSLQPKTVN